MNVHALEQIHRVLTPSGCLIDLRPARAMALAGTPPELPTIYCMTGGRIVRAGRLQKTNIQEHRAASRALNESLRRGWFVATSADTFPFRWYFHGLPVLDAYLKARWSGTVVPALVRRRLRAAVRDDPSARIIVEDTFQLNVLKKV